MFQETKLSYTLGSNFQSSNNKKNPLLIRRNNNKINSIENWLIKVNTNETILLKITIKLLLYLA